MGNLESNKNGHKIVVDSWEYREGEKILNELLVGVNLFSWIDNLKKQLIH